MGTTAIRLRVLECELRALDVEMRMPFRFGNSTVERTPQLTARVLVEVQGGARAEGFASELCVPRWFHKHPVRPPSQDVLALFDSARRAQGAFEQTRTHRTPFELWHEVACGEGPGSVAPANEVRPALERGFGIALFERAMLDAASLAAGASLHQSLRDDLYVFRPGAVHPVLEHWNPRDFLPSTPRDRFVLRHTVGLLDPLVEADLKDQELGDDGLPRTLEDAIRTYGLRGFKIKLSGDLPFDRSRLIHIAALLDELGVESRIVTLDGNEQFESLEVLGELLDDVRRSESGSRLLDGLRFVEQPLDRRKSLDPSVEREVRAFRHAPIFLDEADGDLNDFPRALALGYRGVSVKGCKGIFHALLNLGLGHRDMDRREPWPVQSAEDLTTQAGLSLQQDLAIHAALGTEHVERNGHHYVRGTTPLPDDEVEALLRDHGDLYRRTDFGAAVDVRQGRILCGSLQGPGLGCRIPIRFDQRLPLEDATLPTP